MNYNNNSSDLEPTVARKERGCSAFYMATRMITIKLCSTNEEARNTNVESVKGRVHVYDDDTKILILKIWCDK